MHAAIHTKKVDEVVAIAEPAGGLLPRVVDAVAREVCPERRQLQVVVVPDVRLRIAQHVQRRDQAPMDEDELELGQETNAEKKARSGGAQDLITRRGTHFAVAADSEFQATESASSDLILYEHIYSYGMGEAGRW